MASPLYGDKFPSERELKKKKALEIRSLTNDMNNGVGEVGVGFARAHAATTMLR